MLGHHGDQIEVRDFYFCSFFFFGGNLEPCFGFKSVSTVVALLFWVIFVVSSLSIAFFFLPILLVCQVCWLVKGK